MLTLPTTLYRLGGPHPGPPVDGKSTTYACHDARGEDEFAKLVEDGWFPTLPEAVDPQARLQDGETEQGRAHRLRGHAGERAYLAALEAGETEEDADKKAMAAARAAFLAAGGIDDDVIRAKEKEIDAEVERRLAKRLAALPPSEPAPSADSSPALADVGGEGSTEKIVDLKTLGREDLKALAKDLDGYDGRASNAELIALIEKARA